MSTGAVLRVLGVVAFVAALAACSNPAPRGYAHQGVPAVGDRGTHNAPYYSGADPTYGRLRGSKGGP